jgi:hypothetical protein
MAKLTFAGCARALIDRRPAVVERWLATYGRSALRLPGSVDLRPLQGIADTIAVALGAALQEPDCAPGESALREVEKRIAFAGGSMGMSKHSGFDVAAFVYALRDALSEEATSDAEKLSLRQLCDWFCALAFEGYSVSREDALRMRHRDALERGTPVVLLGPELPAALFVGEPDRSVMDATLGRLLLLVVRVGARAVLLDAGGLVKPNHPNILEALTAFASHRKVAGRLAFVVTQLAPGLEDDWKTCVGTSTELFFIERFEEALDRAHELARRRETNRA